MKKSAKQTAPERKKLLGFSVDWPLGRVTRLRRNSRRGGAIVMATVFVTIAAMVTSYVMLASNRQTRNTHRSVLFDRTLAAAATVVNSMTQQAYYVAQTRPAQLGGNFDKMNEMILSIKPSGLPGFMAAKNGTKELVSFKQTSANNGEWATIDDPDDDWNGFAIRRWSYDAVAFINEQDKTGDTNVGVNAQRLGFEGAGFRSNVQINFVPLYQYAIFYDKDLEFHPGANMSVTGPVHTNSTLWLGAGSGKTLSLMDRVSAAGSFRSYGDFISSNAALRSNIVRSDNVLWKPEGSAHPGDVTIKKKDGTTVKVNGNLITGMDSNGNTFLDSKDANWLNDALSRFGGNLTDKAMGNRPIQPPLPFVGSGTNRKQADPGDLIQRVKSTDPVDLKAVKMESMADILIEGNPTDTETVNGVKRIKNSAITIRPAIIDESTGLVTGYGAAIPNTEASDTKSVDSIVKPGSFQDYRENRKAVTFDVDMAAIQKRTDVSNKIKSGNGVVYVSTNSNVDTSSQMGAVRIINGASVPSKNGDKTLTVATDRPMYLEGDINKDKSATLLLAADALTVLSKRLTDSTAINTAAAGSVETNAIFMLGQVSSKYAPVQTSGNKAGQAVSGVTIDGTEKIPKRGQTTELDHHQDGYGRFQWSGGVHNVMRYLENWGGKKHTYNGSLICLFESKVATTRHQTQSGLGNDDAYYGAPDRSYNWDASLKNKVPPRGMPVLVEVKMSPLTRISKAQAINALK